MLTHTMLERINSLHSQEAPSSSSSGPKTIDVPIPQKPGEKLGFSVREHHKEGSAERTVVISKVS
jgi:hypothetical protein